MRVNLQINGQPAQAIANAVATLSADALRTA